MKSEVEEEIILRLKRIEKLQHQQDNRPLNLVEASEYLSISQSHLYKLTRKKLIPCHKPNGKYLYFFRRELEEWVGLSTKYQVESSKSRNGLRITLDRSEEDPDSGSATLTIKDPNQIEMELEMEDEEPP